MKVVGGVSLPPPERADGAEAAGPESRWSLLIVDDNCLYRETLAHIVSSRPEINCLRTAKDAPSVRAALCGYAPDVVLLNLASRGSAQLTALIRTIAPASRLIVIGASEDAEEEIVRCAEAGVAGYLMRSQSLEQLIALIDSVAVNETLCSPRVTAVLLRRISALAGDASPPPDDGGALTPREREIRDLLELGLSNREIADRLFIEVRRYQAGRGATPGNQAGTRAGYQEAGREGPAEIHAVPR
jgi:DNA-binding NarL/FixJ family response regulator